MRETTRRAKWEKKLADVRKEWDRQHGLVGLRFGVLARLAELEREERRILRKLEALAAGRPGERT